MPIPQIDATVAPMPWPPAEAAKMRDHARSVFSQHTSHADKLSRDNCGACALGRYSELRQPNYAGWLRLWIAAGRLLPELPYKEAMREAAATYPNYYQGIMRDIATFGISVRICQ